MITLTELDEIAQARLDDAKALLAAGRFDAAVYLCGYAAELALKSRICRTLNWLDFPATGAEFQDYRSFQTHDLDVLLRLSGQEARIRLEHTPIWSALATWRAEWRYNPVGTTEGVIAEAMIAAAEALQVAL